MRKQKQGMPVKQFRSDTCEACQECHLSTDGNEVKDEQRLDIKNAAVFLLQDTPLFDYRL